MDATSLRAILAIDDEGHHDQIAGVQAGFAHQFAREGIPLRMRRGRMCG